MRKKRKKKTKTEVETPSISKLKTARIPTDYPDLLGAAWAKASELIKKKPEYWEDLQTIHSIGQGVLSGQYQLWFMYDEESGIKAVMVTLLVSFPAQKVLEVIAVAGIDVVNNIDQLEVVEKWAANQGATMALFDGRVGWKKALAERGYEMKRVIYSRKLEAETV